MVRSVAEIRRFRNRLKRRRISPVRELSDHTDQAPATTPGVVQEVMARQELANLEAAIARLPSGCRAVLLLRKIELLPHQEIARRLGIAVSTVEKQHARALRLLKADLQEANDITAQSRSPAIPKENPS